MAGWPTSSWIPNVGWVGFLVNNVLSFHGLNEASLVPHGTYSILETKHKETSTDHGSGVSYFSADE